MWDFKIQRTGRKGATEVEVNAMTGRIIAVQAGTPAKRPQQLIVRLSALHLLQ